ncbi:MULTISPECIES: hypothetical protein [unclassified Microcoleus]|uniref:hypothetical protein n=1 Tax=unclassified Microcoleus TaxID=2642155 RepID=UPI002FD18A2E
MLHIKSGGIGINITHSQDTAVLCPYSRFPTINPAIVTYLAIAINYFAVGKRHCRVLCC